MYDLLKINNVTFPKPAGFNIDLVDKTNDFEAENGQITVEIIREGIVNISVTYGSLLAAEVLRLKNAITKVSSVTFFNSYANTIQTKSMQVKNLKTVKQYHDNNISTWSLSFSLEEL